MVWLARILTIRRLTIFLFVFAFLSVAPYPAFRPWALVCEWLWMLTLCLAGIIHLFVAITYSAETGAITTGRDYRLLHTWREKNPGFFWFLVAVNAGLLILLVVFFITHLIDGVLGNVLTAK